MNIKGSKKKNQVLSVNIFEQQGIIAKADAIKAGLKASTWHELETRGKFDKNDKLSFVSDGMLILGCDIGSETHYVRAIDTEEENSVSPLLALVIRQKALKAC